VANAGVVQSLLVHLERLSVSADATSSSELLVMLGKYAPQVNARCYCACCPRCV
jgi:hypothetical protein